MEPFIAYLLAGIGVVLIGVFTIGKGSQKNKSCTASATARIVEVRQGTDNDSVTYTPVYAFTVGGTTVRRSGGRYSYKKNEFHVGDTAMVRYNPQRPEEFLVDGKSAAKASGIVLVLFGLVLAAIAFTQI